MNCEQQANADYALNPLVARGELKSPIIGACSLYALRSPLHAPRASGFTLIELLVVMVIAVVIMAVSLPSFLSIGRGAGMRTAVNNVRSTVALSRQWAITHREQITFVASSTGMVYNMTNGVFSKTTNDHACYYAVSAEGTLIQSIADLPLDVTFNPSGANVVTSLTFKTDGGLDNGTTTYFIKLMDKKKATIETTISINGLTGGIRVQ